MKKKYLLLTVIICSVFIFNRCTNTSNQSHNIIKFGSILSLTGEAASYGTQMQQGMEIAMQEINSDSTSKFKFEIIYEDSKFDPKEAVNSCKKLIEIDKVNAIVGITGSKNALAITPIANEKKIIIIDALSSSSKLTTEGGDAYFRIMPSDNFAGKFIANWAFNDGFKKAAIIYVNDGWGNEIKDITTKTFLNLGGKITNTEAINAGVSDFKNVLTKLRNDLPDIIFLLTYSPEAGIIVKQSRELKIAAKFMGSDNLSASEFAKNREKEVVGVMLALPGSGKGNIYEKFKKKYEEKFKSTPSINTIKSYDAIMLAAHIFNSTKTDFASIHNYLINELGVFIGASGDISFDANGDLLNASYDKMIYSDKGTYSDFKE